MDEAGLDAARGVHPGPPQMLGKSDVEVIGDEDVMKELSQETGPLLHDDHAIVVFPDGSQLKELGRVEKYWEYDDCQPVVIKVSASTKLGLIKNLFLLGAPK